MDGLQESIKRQSQEAAETLCRLENDPIDWTACTPKDLYLLEHYGRTEEDRIAARRETRRRRSVSQSE